jgi:hypothetical protein
VHINLSRKNIECIRFEQNAKKLSDLDAKLNPNQIFYLLLAIGAVIGLLFTNCIE